MHQDKITGCYHFQGDEQEDVWSYFWTCIMELSFKGRIETVRTIFKKPPAWVGYKTPEYYKERSLMKKCERENPRIYSWDESEP
jgi:hypothetical protein